MNFLMAQQTLKPWRGTLSPPGIDAKCVCLCNQTWRFLGDWFLLFDVRNVDQHDFWLDNPPELCDTFFC
jgi:hypothetical protein